MNRINPNKYSKSIHGLWVFFGSICFLSCHNVNKDTEQKDKAYEVSSDGKTVQMNASEEHYKMIYRSTGDILEQEGLTPADTSQYNQRKKALDQGIWFQVRMRAKNGASLLRYKLNDPSEYNQRLDYYTNSASADFMLVNGSDTLYPISYWFDNTYNMSPEDVMLIGFERKEVDRNIPNKMTLIYYDRLFKNGLIKASFRIPLNM